MIFGNILSCPLTQKLVGFQPFWALTFWVTFLFVQVLKIMLKIKCESSSLFTGTPKRNNGCYPESFCMCLHSTLLNEVGLRNSITALTLCFTSANIPSSSAELISLNRRLQWCVYTVSRSEEVWLYFVIQTRPSFPRLSSLFSKFCCLQICVLVTNMFLLFFSWQFLIYAGEDIYG